MARTEGSQRSLPALMLQPITLALPQLGLDPSQIFARCGVADLAVLNDPHAQLPATVELDLWSALVTETGDPLIGLKLADEIPTGGYWTYEYLLRNSPTVGAALEKAVRYQRLFANDVQLSLLDSGTYTIARLEHECSAAYPHPAQGTECLFAVVFRVVGALVPSARAKEVRFTHPRLGATAEYSRRFGCRMRFEQPQNEVVFPTALLEREVASADQRLAGVLEEHVQRVLASGPNIDPWLPRARAALELLLATGSTSLPDLARSLHVSARTLRRRLAERGTSYRELLDEVRRGLALQRVTGSAASFDEIASGLGFNDVSAFYRAFRRWAETTPAAYRARNVRAV